MTTAVVTIETGVLADAVNRAARIAPTKGRAWDTAQGILIEVVPEAEAAVRISATNLDVTYYQRVPAVDPGEVATAWRVPSALASGWLSNLPMNAGTQVTLTEVPNRDPSQRPQLQMKAGRSRTKMKLLPAGDFPRIRPFDPQGLEDVPHLARRISQVAWAARTDGFGPLTGIFISGSELVACDGVRICTMPCVVAGTSPFAAPLTTLTTVLRDVDDVKLRVTPTEAQIMPDPDTQIAAKLFQEPYPDVKLLVSTVAIDHKITFSREQLMDALERVLVLVKGERYPRIDLAFYSDHLDMSMTLPEVGEMEDVVDVLDGPNDPFEISFSPTNLLGVVRNANRETLNLEFCTDANKPVKFTDESGFTAWLMPMNKI